MPVRRDPIDDAELKAMAQLRRIVGDMRAARDAAGLSQARVARAVGCSRQLISALERGRDVDVGVRRLARAAAAIGLEVSVRSYLGRPVLRDEGQLRLLARLRTRLAEAPWTWSTEVPVTADPDDRRAFDALLRRGTHRVGIEAVTNLSDAQAQVRPIHLKQRDAGVGCVILLIADTRHNRAAVLAAEPTLAPAFQTRRRAILRDLRAGRVPDANGMLLL